MTELLTADDFKGTGKRRFETYPCPFLPGKSLRCRSLFESETADFELDTISTKGGLLKDRMRSARRRAIAMIAVDAEGNPFLDEQAIEAMAVKDSRFVDWAYKTCRDHAGIDQDDVDFAVKNSVSLSSETSDDDSPAC